MNAGIAILEARTVALFILHRSKGRVRRGLAPFPRLEIMTVLKLPVPIGQLIVDTLRLFKYIEKMSNVAAKLTARE
jgi:hypothetical protein